MKDTPLDWWRLSDILQELTSFDHRFRRAFNDSFEIESAITNAACSGEVAVRGRRYNDFSMRNSAFERIDKYLGAKSYVDISLNRINIPDDGAVLSVIIPPITTRFTDVQADLRGVEKWIFENSLPPWWRQASAEQSTPSRRGAPPKYAWNAIRDETFRLMEKNGEFDLEKPHWNVQARLEQKLQEFCGEKLDDEPGPSTLRDKIPRWLADWRKQKRVAGN
jgi:hypothetical protein